MIWNAAGQAIKTLISTDDKSKAIGGLKRNSIIKRTLGLADQGIPIGREEEPAGYVRWTAAKNDRYAPGTVTGHEPELRWKEFIWSGPQSIDECDWGEVRWRFYANGLICFDARMANSSRQLDNGDVQGHRIELRETSGLLLGVWIAGFFVRKNLPLRGFATSFSDAHEPLKLHFVDIAEEQAGAWVCI